MKPARVEAVFGYALAVAAQADHPRDRELGPIHLLKYLYLADVAYAEAHGCPRNRKDLAGHPLIAGGGGQVGAYYRAWLRHNGLEQAVAMQHGSVTGLLSAVRSGLGLAALPCMVAEMDDGLVRCLPPGGGTTQEIWLLTHERLRRTPRVFTAQPDPLTSTRGLMSSYLKRAWTRQPR